LRPARLPNMFCARLPSPLIWHAKTVTAVARNPKSGLGRLSRLVRRLSPAALPLRSRRKTCSRRPHREMNADSPSVLDLASQPSTSTSMNGRKSRRRVTVTPQSAVAGTNVGLRKLSVCHRTLLRACTSQRRRLFRPFNPTCWWTAARRAQGHSGSPRFILTMRATLQVCARPQRQSRRRARRTEPATVRAPDFGFRATAMTVLACQIVAWEPRRKHVPKTCRSQRGAPTVPSKEAIGPVTEIARRQFSRPFRLSAGE